MELIMCFFCVNDYKNNLYMQKIKSDLELRNKIKMPNVKTTIDIDIFNNKNIYINYKKDLEYLPRFYEQNDIDCDYDYDNTFEVLRFYDTKKYIFKKDNSENTTKYIYKNNKCPHIFLIQFLYIIVAYDMKNEKELFSTTSKNIYYVNDYIIYEDNNSIKTYNYVTEKTFNISNNSGNFINIIKTNNEYIFEFDDLTGTTDSLETSLNLFNTDGMGELISVCPEYPHMMIFAKYEKEEKEEYNNYYYDHSNKTSKYMKGHLLDMYRCDGLATYWTPVYTYYNSNTGKTIEISKDNFVKWISVESAKKLFIVQNIFDFCDEITQMSDTHIKDFTPFL